VVVVVGVGSGIIIITTTAAAAAVATNYTHRNIHTYTNGGYLVDPASSHMLVSKIKPCILQDHIP